MLTLGSLRPILWNDASSVPYSTAQQSDKDAFDAKLNQVIDRFRKAGYSDKQAVALTIYTDNCGNYVITLPRGLNSVLAAVPNDPNCFSNGLTTRSDWFEYLPNGHGLSTCNNRDIIAMPGRFCTFQDWSTPMLLRFKFEATEEAGTILIRGTYNGDEVYSLYSSDWIKGEKVAFTGTTTVTSTKYFDSENLQVIKPVTLGRVTMYAVDLNNVEALVASYDPNETVPNWRRYKVPQPSDAVPLSSTNIPQSQFYTKDEIDSMFADAGTIAVSSTGTHDLVYAAYFLRIIKVTAAAGSGSYIHNFLLDNSTVKSGGTLRVVVSVVASANPVLKFYDNSTGGTLLYEVDGDSDNVQDFTLVFSYNGTAWKCEGREN